MICIFTVVHPKSLIFFNEFIKSINNQSYRKFELFIACSEIKLSKDLLSKIKCKYHLFYSKKSYGILRKLAFDKLKYYNFDLLIFVDSDDILHRDRIRVDMKNIKDLDFVVSNLKIFNKEKKKIKKHNLFINIKNNRLIKLEHIDKKNFIGFSNLSVKSSAFFSIYNKINYNLKALDWAIAKLLVLKNYKGRFFNKFLTYYRIYEHNMSILNQKVSTSKHYCQLIDIKIQHLEYFQKYQNMNYKHELERIKKLKIFIMKNKILSKDLQKIFYNRNFWWDF